MFTLIVTDDCIKFKRQREMRMFLQQLKDFGAGDMDQWLRILAEDLGSIPNTDISDNFL